MNPCRLLLPLALATFACTPSVRTASAPAPATNEYRTLLARLQAKDTSINFTALRLAYAASPDYSPYVVISVAEEYAVLGMNHYQSGMRSLSKCGTRPCDILETTHRDTQEKRTFHFDITLPMTYMSRQFEGKH